MKRFYPNLSFYDDLRYENFAVSKVETQDEREDIASKFHE